MARMHSRKRGKSKSKRPYRTTIPEWVEIDKKEIEEIVINLSKKGASASKIGVVLRDQHGIPSTKLMTEKRISQILDENNMSPDLPEDLMNLISTSVALDRHRTNNPKDMTAKRGMQLVNSKINRLAKYYKREGRIPSDWKYNLENAKLLVR
tara:strand:+ start:438 stop:893 length:456 start_codon:yes stop_codon:yes gene_type:complete